MSIELVRLLAQTFSSSILNSARPALTFFTIQLAVIYMSWMEVAVVPDNFAWLISPVTISVAGFLAILEHFALHEEDVQNMLHEFNVTPLLSAFGAFASALLFSSLGLPVEEAANLIDGESSNKITEATQNVMTSHHSAEQKFMIVIASVAGNVILTHYRVKLYLWLDEMSLEKVWLRIETGGVLVALGLLVFAPLLCLVLLFVLLIAGAIFTVAINKAQAVMDARNRYGCPHCGNMIRVEALYCYSCHNDVTPKLALNEESKAVTLLDVLQNKRSKSQAPST